MNPRLPENQDAEQANNAARGRQLRQLEKGLSLGTFGRIAWTRDQLHER
jgi:hypothetical protein